MFEYKGGTNCGKDKGDAYLAAIGADGLAAKTFQSNRFKTAKKFLNRLII
ncbi:hypothetical protein [Rhizobium oryzicola]|uniref:Uncharacterized protein n=1 Tax=Rhizobium oryzicola TaxID=1232668 RepID=A0ABT8T209_9HYPH|nr:hypothetical protein [Rhizobium oryzicola]MDO1584697.1 hypothetical protein [Rhizobium oryzicola]